MTKNVIDTYWIDMLEMGRCSFGEFLQYIQHVDVTDQQQKIVDAFDNDANKLACKSGHGTGKSFLFANLAIYYLCKYDDAIIPVTGASFVTLQKTFFKEVVLAFERLPECLQDKFNLKSESIERIKTIGKKVVPATSYLVLRTSRDGDKVKATALQGFHSDHLMVLVDEASGVAQAVFNAIKGALTSKGAIIAMIGNPELLSGEFYNAFHSHAHLWTTFTFSCLDSPRVDESYIEDYRVSWGEDHDQYRIRVLGEFPKSEEGCLIELEDIMKCVDLDLGNEYGDDVRFGVDVGGQGSDPSVICKMRGNTVYDFVEYSKTRGPDLEGKVMFHCNEDDAQSIKIDNIGIGSGVAEHLEDALPGIAIGVCNAAKAYEHLKFKNTRAESYWKIREAVIAKEISLPNNPKLIAQLSSMKYTVPMGKIFLLPKEKIKETIGRSPDHADSLVLAFYEPQSNFCIA